MLPHDNTNVIFKLNLLKIKTTEILIQQGKHINGADFSPKVLNVHRVSVEVLGAE